MKCSGCAKDSNKEDKFCRSCGEQLPDEEIFSCECGADVSKEDKFCHNCGAPFSTAGICSCGIALADNAKFCHNCGKEIVSESVEEQPEDIADEPNGHYKQNADGSHTFIKDK